MAAATQTSVRNNNAYTVSGKLGGTGSYISWTGTVTDKIASVAGIPYNGFYTAYFGGLQAMTGLLGTTAAWNDDEMLSLGAPYSVVGLGLFAGQLNTTSTDAIAYAFSSPVPAGSSFMLVDPGASYPEYTGSETYKVSATYGGAPVSTAGWTFTVVGPSRAAPNSGISINAATGTLTVSSYAGSAWPDSMVVITPNTPVSSLTVTANTIPYDFWALTLPHIPKALALLSVNSGPSTAGTYSVWQINGAALTGGGAIANPGAAWTYEGSGDFLGDGGTDMLFRNQNGTLVYWAVSGTSIYAAYTLANPGGTWSVVGLGDFNNDGSSDILFADAAGDLAVWYIHASNILGGGMLGNPGPGYTFKGTADINGDGDADILFESSSGIYIDWMMHGTTIWAANTLGAGPAGDVFVGFGDFNGDNRADILFENPYTGQYVAWIMGGGATIARTVTLCAPGPYEKLVSIGTYTASGYSDLIFQNTQSGALDDYVISNSTLSSVGAIGNPGALQAVATAPYALPPPPTPTVLFTDANGDFASWGIRYGTTVGGMILSGPGSGWTMIGAGNFDGSGRPDILLASSDGSGDYSIWLTNGAQLIGGGNLGVPGGTWQYKGLGDFNGDGINDLLYIDAAGDYSAWLLDGTQVLAQDALGNPGAGYALAGVADLTGDGITDLIFLDPSGNYDAWFIADGGFAGTTTIGTPGAGWSLIGTGDFNGDGKSDLLFENSGGNFLTWDMNGAAVVGGGAFNGPGVGWSFFGVAAINGNLDASILFENASTGALEAYNMYDATVASASSLGTPGAGWTARAVI